MPELDDAEEADVVINPDPPPRRHLSIDGRRAASTSTRPDSAVRLTHLPTGIVVSMQNERSQMKNRDLAMKVMRSRLFQRRQEEAAQERAELRGEVLPAEFGSQIRNYVLQPYTLVKDLRSGVELGNAQAVLDGEIELLLEGWLRWRLGETASPVGAPSGPT